MAAFLPKARAPSSNHVFALSGPDDMLRKLHWEIGQLKQALKPRRSFSFGDEPAYAAFNCAVTSWHLTDWVWEGCGDQEMRSQLCERLAAAEESLLGYQSALGRKHRSIYICQQIATGSKHSKPRRPDPNVKAEEVWQLLPPMAGRLRAGQRLGSRQYRLTLVDKDVRRDLLEIFQEAAERWEDELRASGFIEDRYIDDS
jgi:hypothetical protein